MNVVILHQALGDDARADELDVLEQVRAIGAALDALGHSSHVLAITADLEPAVEGLRALAPDVVCNLVEDLDGDGRLIDLAPAMLERLGIPYTGSGPAATRSAASKLATKKILAAHGLPSPAWMSLEQLRLGCRVPRGRYILKSVWEHGSLGLEADSVVVAHDAASLGDELERRLDRLGGVGFAESYVHGREFNLALLEGRGGVEHLPPAEVRFGGDDAAAIHIVGYRAKWSAGSPEDTGTPRRFVRALDEAALVAELQALARSTWDAFGLRGYARVDMRVDADGHPWIIDVNTNPCLSPDAGFSAALREAGIPFVRAVERLLAAAVPSPAR